MQNFIKNNVILLVLINSASVFAYLFQLVLGKNLTPADYGVFNSLNSIVAILATPAVILHIVFSRFIVKLSISGLGQVKSLFIKVFRNMLFVSAGVFLVGLATLPLIKNFLHLKTSLPIIMMLLALSVCLIQPMLFGFIEGLQRFTFLGIGCISGSLARFAFAFILVGILGWGVNGAILAGILAMGLAIGFGFWGLKDIFNVSRGVLPSNLFSEMLRYSIPVFFTTIMVLLLGNIDLILVRHFCSPEEAGLYATAAVLGRISFFLPGAILMVLFPSIAKAQSTGENETNILWISLGMTFFIGGGIALINILWPEQIISFLFDEQYIEAAPLLQIISTAMALLGTSNVIFSFSLARSDFNYLKILLTGIVLMIGMVSVFHDSPIIIAKILLSSIGIIFFGTLIWLALTYKNIRSTLSDNEYRVIS